MHFFASYDRNTKAISAVVCLGLVAVVFTVHNVVVACLSLFVLLLGCAYSPRGYLLDGRSILIKRLAGTARVALDEVREARRATPEDLQGCVRLWGSGGLFGYYGLFSTTKLGKATWYVTNRSNAVVLIGAKKTVLLSPDDPDGFLASIRSVAPQTNAGLDAAFVARPRSSALGSAIAVGATLAGLGVAALAIAYAPGAPSYTLTSEALTIHDRFYPVTLRASDVDMQGIRIVDLRQNTEWRPVRRSNGFANSHYRAGWFQLADGRKVRLYQADSQFVVLLPPKGDSAPVLYEAAGPEKFVREIRTAWRATAK
jgi:Bacterial PH domain